MLFKKNKLAQAQPTPHWQQTELDLDFTRSLRDAFERLPSHSGNDGRQFLLNLLDREGAANVLQFMHQTVDAKGNVKPLGKESFSAAQRELLKNVCLSKPKATRNVLMPTIIGGAYTVIEAPTLAHHPTITGGILASIGLAACGTGISELVLQSRAATVAQAIDHYIAFGKNQGFLEYGTGGAAR